MKKENPGLTEANAALYVRIFGEHNPIYRDKINNILILLALLKENAPSELFNEDGSDGLYNEMLALARKYEIENPFQTKEHFFDLLIVTRKYISWAFVFKPDFAGKYFSHIPQIPDFIFAEFKKGSKDANNILIPNSEVFGDKIVDFVTANQNAKFTITFINYEIGNIYKTIFKFNENVTVLGVDSNSSISSKEQFDYICTIPQFAFRIDAREGRNTICRDLSLSQMEECLNLLSENGTLSIVLTSKIGFAGGEVERFRKYLNENYNVKSISELPNGLFEYISIKTYLLTVTKKNVDEVLINKYSYKSTLKNKREVTLQKELKIESEEFKKRENWVVERIVSNEDKILSQFMSKFEKVVNLNEVSEVFRGKVVNRDRNAISENGNVGFINISNISTWDLDYANIEKIEVDDDRKFRNYFLEDGDLLLASRGTVLKCAVFKEQSIKCIASSNITVIRPNKNVLSAEYLKVFFDSKPGSIALDALKQGEIIVAISYQELKNLKIPLPTLEEQKKISEKFLSELKTYKDSLALAEARWSKAQDEIFKSL